MDLGKHIDAETAALMLRPVLSSVAIFGHIWPQNLEVFEIDYSTAVGGIGKFR